MPPLFYTGSAKRLDNGILLAKMHYFVPICLLFVQHFLTILQQLYQCVCVCVILHKYVQQLQTVVTVNINQVFPLKT